MQYMIYYLSMNIKKTSRLTIFKELVNTDTSIQFSYAADNYRVPVDDLYSFLELNTNVLKTSSWIDRGIYHWPRPTKKLLKFLESYKITLDDEEDVTDNHWFRMFEKLREYSGDNGHCYIPSDYKYTYDQ